MFAFAAEFIGTVVFAVVVLLVVSFVSSNLLFWTSLSIGLGLGLGIWVCLLLGGPGYLNPAIAVLLGVKDGKSAAFTGGMVLAEFVAIFLVLSLYYLGGFSRSSSSSSSISSSS